MSVIKFCFIPLPILFVCKCSQRVWQSSICAAGGTGPVGVSALPDAFRCHNKPLSVRTLFDKLISRIGYSFQMPHTLIMGHTVKIYCFGLADDRLRNWCIGTASCESELCTGQIGIHYKLCSAQRRPWEQQKNYSKVWKCVTKTFKPLVSQYFKRNPISITHFLHMLKKTFNKLLSDALNY